jgi:hypothetical protein
VNVSGFTTKNTNCYVVVGGGGRFRSHKRSRQTGMFKKISCILQRVPLSEKHQY